MRTFNSVLYKGEVMILTDKSARSDWLSALLSDRLRFFRVRSSNNQSTSLLLLAFFAKTIVLIFSL